MKITQDEILRVLQSFNPWWNKEPFDDLPNWQRAAFNEIMLWINEPPAHRALFISGARQVGKTTLVLQAIERLIREGINPQQILYATFDHPILKLAGLDAVMQVWNQIVPNRVDIDYLFIDEAQFIPNWSVFVKHETDFNKKRRIIFTGSATPLIEQDSESGVGRWHSIRLTTLSFFEYLRLKKIPTPNIPYIKSLAQLFNMTELERINISRESYGLANSFHDYLIRGGFPQTALVESHTQAQKLLREDIIDKVLKRDMTVLFGVRQVFELEKLFIYLCRHNGGMIDMNVLCGNLEVKRPTAEKFIDLLVATHLIFKLERYGYGKEVLRGKSKIYLADPALSPAILLKSRQYILENNDEIGVLVENAVLKHLVMRYYRGAVGFSYWLGKKDVEIDLIAHINDRFVPFEIKYRGADLHKRDIKGLIQFCEEKSIKEGYVITKSLDEFGFFTLENNSNTRILKIPAPLLCYWLGAMEGYN